MDLANFYNELSKLKNRYTPNNIAVHIDMGNGIDNIQQVVYIRYNEMTDTIVIYVDGRDMQY